MESFFLRGFILFNLWKPIPVSDFLFPFFDLDNLFENSSEIIFMLFLLLPGCILSFSDSSTSIVIIKIEILLAVELNLSVDLFHLLVDLIWVYRRHWHLFWGSIRRKRWLMAWWERSWGKTVSCWFIIWVTLTLLLCDKNIIRFRRSACCCCKWGYQRLVEIRRKCIFFDGNS